MGARKDIAAGGILALHIAPPLPHLTAMTRAHHPAKTLSQMLTEAVSQGTGAYISIADLIAGIKTQALALLLIIFALVNVLPSLPGTSAVTGLPLTLLTLQMAIGRGVWLPKIIANRAVPRAGLLALLHRAQPYFLKVEKLLHPRLSWMTSPIAQRLLGALMMLLSVIILLPIPLGNAAPALAIMFIAIGMTERDGAFVLIGLVVAVIAITLLFTVYWALISLTIWQFGLWFAP